MSSMLRFVGFPAGQRLAECHWVSSPVTSYAFLSGSAGDDNDDDNDDGNDLINDGER